MDIIDLDDCAESLLLLKSFHSGVYSREFPDPNERESLENMAEYLRLKAAGWYGLNNYHILLLRDDAGVVQGGIVADYFERSNAGMIEFTVIDSASRGQGWGRQLLSSVGERFAKDAMRAGHAELNGICGEVNDPYRRCDVEEHLDGFARMRMWDRLGFGLLDFPYVQPALGPGQEAVRGLGLMFCPARAEYRRAVPAALTKQIVADYLILAMRIPEPKANADYLTMEGWLDARSEVPLLNMTEYVCGEENPPFSAVRIEAGDTARLKEFSDLYEQTFRSAATAVSADAFRGGSRTELQPVAYDYWLWGVATGSGDGALQGFASFFSFPHCGFGGYLALTGSLRGRGGCKRLLRLIEGQMVRANPVARGWYIECEPDSAESIIFRRCDFTEVPMIYLQPKLPTDLSGASEGKKLELLYKPFGRNYFPPVLSPGDLQREVSEFLSGIYQLEGNGLETAMRRMGWPARAREHVFADVRRDSPMGE